MTITYLVLILAIILIFVLVLKKLKIANLTFLDWIKVEFWPSNQDRFLLSTMDKIGFVVSQNNLIYKLHTKTTYKGTVDTSINNAMLFISGIGWFVFRLFFEEITGGRRPASLDRILRKDNVYEINFEFEPKEGWNNLSLKKKEYKALLIIRLLDETIQHKFIFQIREQNLRAIGQKRNKQAEVIEVPIVRN